VAASTGSSSRLIAVLLLNVTLPVLAMVAAATVVAGSGRRPVHVESW
jgi:hypothetical protein